MKLSGYTDEELVGLLSEDNEEAFRILYHRYWKKMLVKAYAQLGTHTDAEELVQDIFVAVWKRRHSIQLRHSFHTYLAAMVKYEVMARIAKSARVLYTDDHKLAAIEDNSTQQGLDFDELRDLIESNIQALPEKCQLVFRLSREQGLSEKQIAQTLQISSKTVEAHISKALKTLRAALRHALTTLLSLLLFFSL